MQYKYTAKDIVLTLILVFLIGFPAVQYSAIGIEGIYNTKRLFEIGLLIFFGLLLLSVKNLRSETSRFVSQLPKIILGSLWVIFLIGIISSLFSEFRDWAFLEVGHYLLMMLITFMVASIAYSDTKKVFYYLSIAVVAVISIYLLRVILSYMIYQFGYYPLWPGDGYSVGLYGFANRRFFNHMQTWTLPIIISIGWYYWKCTDWKLAKWALFILIVLWESLLIASGGRGTTIGILTGFLILSFLLIREPWKFLRYNLVAVFAGFMVYFVFFKVLAVATTKSLIRGTSSGRIDMWIELIPDILQKPIFGYGPMHFASITLNNKVAAPHNLFLQFAYEWGIPVALILITTILYGLYRMYCQQSRNVNSDFYSEKKLLLKFGLLWSIFSAFIHSFFSGLFITPLSQVWLVFIIGTSIGIYYNEVEGNSKHEFKESSRILVLLVLFAFGTYIYWANNNPINQEKQNHLYLENIEHSRLDTRFWQQGKIGLEE